MTFVTDSGCSFIYQEQAPKEETQLKVLYENLVTSLLLICVSVAWQL